MNKKAPIFHISKKENTGNVKAWLIRISSIFAALLLGCILFAAIGINPFEAYASMLAKTFGSAGALRQLVRTAVPLLGVGIALAPCFRMKFWNCGGEGQITVGAIGAAFAAYNFSGLPSFLLLILMALFAMLLGALWAAIPAFFKAGFRTNETLFTLMMNYIAIGFAAYLVGGPWEGVPGSQIAAMFTKNAVLPKLFGVHAGWIIVLLITVLMFVYLKYTKHGYEIAVLGESENTARYAGMKVSAITVRTVALSGAICGLVGFIIASGANQTIYSDCAGGVGFTGIVVAWLSALNPFVMIVISMLLAFLSRGGSALSTYMGVPSSCADILSGIILLCMLGSEFFINYSIVFRHKEKESK